MASKKNMIFKLVSTAGTGYFYTSSKNAANKQNKIEKNMYDPVAGKHVLFKEEKIK